MIEKLGENQTIYLNRVSHGPESEWELARIIDFKHNFETISKKGRDALGTWSEAWYEKDGGHEKWARKEGENYVTKDKWREEWKESDGGAQKQCEKWAMNTERNEEWAEKWGEQFTDGKREKWADKWFVDWNSGFKRGENWGHEYDKEMQPKHHWCEHWDN